MNRLATQLTACEETAAIGGSPWAVSLLYLSVRDPGKSGRLSIGLRAYGTALRETLFGFRVPTGPGDGLMDARAPCLHGPWTARFRAGAGGPEEAKAHGAPLSVVLRLLDISNDIRWKQRPGVGC